MLRIGLVGCGTVGGGVVNLITRHSKEWKSLGLDISIESICVSSLTKPHPEIPSNVSIVTDPFLLINNDDINVIVEVMGGCGLAKEVVLKSLEKGKHVITANKALLALCLTEIGDLLAKSPELRIGYEAAVCGGIPIIHTLQDGLAVDPVVSICGILNGTTNFMLSEMEQNNLDYHVVLKQAQDLGFAEADPTADVGGFDVQSKLALLAKLCFGTTFTPSKIPTVGITRLTAVDFEYAKLMECTIKMVGKATRKGNTVELFVSPALVSKNQTLASIHGATNMVQVVSESLGESAYVGQGAGRYPTAQSIIADVIQLAKGQMPPPFPVGKAPLDMDVDFSSRFYVRLVITDGMGIITAIGKAAEEAGVSIYSILQLPIKDPQHVDFVVTTDMAKQSKVSNMCSAVNKFSFCLEEPLALPILE